MHAACWSRKKHQETFHLDQSKVVKRPATLLVAVGTSKPLLGKASKIDLAPWTSWRCQHGLSSAQYGYQWPIRIIVHPVKVSTFFKSLSVWAMSICLHVGRIHAWYYEFYANWPTINSEIGSWMWHLASGSIEFICYYRSCQKNDSAHPKEQLGSF